MNLPRSPRGRALDHACRTAGGARALPAYEQVIPSSELSRLQGDSSALAPLRQLFSDLHLRMTIKQKLSLWVPLFSRQCRLSPLISSGWPFSCASVGELLFPSQGCSPPCCQLQPCPSTGSSPLPLPPGFTAPSAGPSLSGSQSLSLQGHLEELLSPHST